MAKKTVGCPFPSDGWPNPSGNYNTLSQSVMYPEFLANKVLLRAAMLLTSC